MKINKITIENYKSFHLPVTITFPKVNDKRNIFLIGGMNGAGKTAFTEAINICLYGARNEFIFHGINSKEKAKGNAYVSFELIIESDDHEEIKIKRSWSAGIVDSPSYRDLEEKLRVTRDGKLVTMQNKEMWQDYINATIPRSITQFFFFDGEKIQEIAADDHSEVRLKTSLEAALGIRYISRLADDIIKLKNDERKNYIDVSVEDIDFKNSELKREEAKLEKFKKEREDYKQELEDLRKAYDELRERFKLTFSTDPKTRQEIEDNERRLVNVSTKIGNLETQIKNIIEKYLPWAIAGKILPSLKEQIEKEQEFKSKQNIGDKAPQLANYVIKSIDNPTPIYDKKLNEDQKKILYDRLVNIFEEDIHDGETILNLSERDMIKILNKIDEIENSEILLLTRLIEQKEEFEIEKTELSKTNLACITETEIDLFDNIQMEMESYQSQISTIKIKLETIEEEIIIKEKKSLELNSELQKLYEKHDISKEKAEFITECDDISDLLKNFIIKLRRKKIKTLQEKTYTMYKLLASKAALIKDLKINEKTYEVVIRDQEGNEVKKSSLAAGEKEIFAVSLLWGLAQTSQLELPIIIDTPLSRLDSIHRDNIVNKYFPNAADQVIILSTDTEIDKNYFDSLEPNLAGAGKLVFNKTTHLTQYEDGYFWKKE